MAGADELEKLGFESDDAGGVTRERWLQAQRDLITTTLDYNLEAIHGLVENRRIDLSPSFQRRDRWDVVRKSRLIESFLMNVPLPPVFLNEDEYGEYSIIDGKQRLTAVYDFLSDRFSLTGLTVFEEANGLRFSQLDRSLRSVLETRASLRAIILLRLSDPLIKYHVFQRLNTGGIRLNAQEVRNVSFKGELNDELVDLSQQPLFQRLLGIDSQRPERSAVWREMRDVELVLRYLTLSEGWETFTGQLAFAMNDFMARGASLSKSALKGLSRKFLAGLDRVDAAFGDLAFRRLDTKRDTYGRARLATLFDAQMIATEGIDVEALRAASAEIVSSFELLFFEPDFVAAIGASTNTPRYVRTRVNMARSAILGAVEGT